MLSCGDLALHYALILYDKSKIQMVREIAEELPLAPVSAYFLCDSWRKLLLPCLFLVQFD